MIRVIMTYEVDNVMQVMDLLNNSDPAGMVKLQVINPDDNESKENEN
jgi:hypothetical protein